MTEFSGYMFGRVDSWTHHPVQITRVDQHEDVVTQHEGEFPSRL